MAYRVVRNTGDGPIVVDSDGRYVQPGDWSVVKMTPELERAITSGKLVDRTDQITSKSSQEAWDAKLLAQHLEQVERSSPSTMSGGDASSPDAEDKAATE